MTRIPQRPADLPGDYAGLADLFVTTLEIERKSPRTIQSYLEALGLFGQFLTAHSLPAVVCDPTPAQRRKHEWPLRQQVRDFLAEYTARINPRTGQPMSAAAVANRQRSLAAFFTWCVTEEQITRSPLEKMHLPKGRQTPPPILSEADLTLLIQTCTGADRKSFYNRRDLAILLLAIDCGLRRSEIGALAVEDVDLPEGTVLIRHGKGDKQRVVPFSHATALALKHYLLARGTYPRTDALIPAAQDQPPLATGQRRHPLWLGMNGPMGAAGIAHVVETRAAQAGLEGVHPHLFRHTFAHNWLLQGGGIDTLKRAAGWESDRMAYYYGAAGVDQRTKAAQQRHSLADRVADRAKGR